MNELYNLIDDYIEIGDCYKVLEHNCDNMIIEDIETKEKFKIILQKVQDEK